MHVRFLHLSLSILTLFCASTFIFPVPVEATRLFLETPQTAVGVGQYVEVSVYVHSEGETVNAFMGTVHTPSFITVHSVRDGGSLVALWSKRPEISGNDIVFEGIVPGGWHGTKGLLFSFVVETSIAGEGFIEFSEVEVLLHDGEGTPTPLSLMTLSLSADVDVPLTEFREIVEDYEPPEAFTLSIERDSELFAGDAFLVFTAQDKGSGVDHYEVLETRRRLLNEMEGEWEHVKSPYLLNDQSLRSFVYVRALDRVGNVRVSVYTPEEQRTTSSAFVILTILLLLIIGMFFIRRWRD